MLGGGRETRHVPAWPLGFRGTDAHTMQQLPHGSDCTGCSLTHEHLQACSCAEVRKRLPPLTSAPISVPDSRPQALCTA